MEQLDDSRLRETPLERTSLYEGRIIRVYDDTVRLPEGRTTHREVVEHHGAVTVVALDEEGRVILVRQWRHPVGRALWELPAGTRDHDGEEPEATARRELAEETGFQAQQWRGLGHGPMAPGYSSEEMFFFAARGLTSGPASNDPDELLDVRPFTQPEVADLVAAGEVDVKTVAGLALAGWSLPVPDA